MTMHKLRNPNLFFHFVVLHFEDVYLGISLWRKIIRNRGMRVDVFKKPMAVFLPFVDINTNPNIS